MRSLLNLLFLALVTLIGNEALAKSNSVEYNSSVYMVTELDTMVFDLSQAFITTEGSTTFIEFPISLRSSDESINAVDYFFQFDLNKLTYVSTTTIDPELEVYSFFNLNSQYLSNTSSASSNTVFLSLNVPIMKLKFSLSDPCLDILPTDFFNTTTLINGLVSSSLFIGPNDPIDSGIIALDVICAENEILFSYAETVNGKAISIYEWDFGNGLAGSGQNTSTIYDSPGVYSVLLSLTTIDGCTYTVSQEFTVVPTPIVGFSGSYDGNLNLVSFTNNTEISNGTVSSYSWDFGDGNTSTQFEPTHTYSNDGNYTVTLSASSGVGCTASFTSIVGIVSITEQDLSNSWISFYPNPVNSDLTINSASNAHFFIVDKTGRRVSEDQFVIMNQTKIVNTNHLANGLYTLIATGNNSTAQKRFIVQH